MNEGPETIGGMFAEPIMGAGGVVVPPRGYFPKIQAVLKKYDILFVADEVICGFHRHRQSLGLPDLRHRAGHDLHGEGAVGLLPADFGPAGE